jgi:acyl-CoA synthetase (AMP-forming)/AMP-acid ligase II
MSAATQPAETVDQLLACATVPELLDRAAATHGGRPLLNFFEEGVVFTYAELRDATDRLATMLRGRGVGVGTPVAVVVPNVPLFPVAWLALLRLGAILVPANPRFTEAELRFVLEDSGAAFLLVHEGAADVAHAAAAGLVDPARVFVWSGTSIETFAGPEGLEALPNTPDAAWPAATSEDVAGYHYTSGTTGFPKACVLTHESWLECARTLVTALPRPPRRILSDAPYFYVDAPFELLLAMASGAEQYVARRVSLSRFTGWVVEHDIDYLELWETLADRVVDPDAEARLRLRDDPIVATTYGLRAGAREGLEQRFGAAIREFYGMTEVGIAIHDRYDAESPDDGSCGSAADNRELRVVDPDTGQDVSPGETGELWVRGPGVLKRYHNRPEVNSVSFVDGWFRTGDLFTRSAEGRYWIVGRLKDMIRRSHENIAASEVEEALKAVPGVDDAGVVGVPDAVRGEEVKAFVVLEANASLTPAQLRAGSAERLADFKVPRYVEVLKALPLTPSGKVKKAALKELDAEQVHGWDAETDREVTR